MIKKMQHAYIQGGEKFYAFIEPVLSKREVGPEEFVITDAHNFYLFDAQGYCWLQMIHVELEYVLDHLGNGFFRTRYIYTIDTPVASFRIPTVASDEWIQGSADRGFAIETIRGSLGLNLTYLTRLIEEDSSIAHESALDKQGD